jgi:hypothetical protein
MERAAQVITARHVVQVIDKNKGTPLTLDEARETAGFMDKDLWEGWKSSSQSFPGKILQTAIADELGGRLRAVHSNFDKAENIARANNDFIGGYEAVKAYVRGKWETTQYMLDESGDPILNLYRGLRDQPISTLPTAKGPGGYSAFVRLPTVVIERNGAASMTLDKNVAEDFAGHTTNSVGCPVVHA